MLKTLHGSRIQCMFFLKHLFFKSGPVTLCIEQRIYHWTSLDHEK